jgi:hypothetical protein
VIELSTLLTTRSPVVIYTASFTSLTPGAYQDFEKWSPSRAWITQRVTRQRYWPAGTAWPLERVMIADKPGFGYRVEPPKGESGVWRLVAVLRVPA